MTKEEQLGVPPVEVMRQLLDENRVLVRLLSTHATDHDVNFSDPEPCTETDPSNALVSAYRELLELLEILSATSAPGIGAETSGR